MTRISVDPRDSDTSTTTSPRSVNLIALPTRLTRIWRSRTGSPTSRVRHVLGDEIDELEPLAARSARQTGRSARRWPRADRTASAESSNLPASIFAKSRMSLMMPSSAWPERVTLSTQPPLAVVQRRRREQVGHAEHAVHRRADLVAHRRQELRLREIGGLGLLARPDQLRFRALAFGDVAQNAGEEHSSPLRFTSLTVSSIGNSVPSLRIAVSSRPMPMILASRVLRNASDIARRAGPVRFRASGWSGSAPMISSGV